MGPLKTTLILLAVVCVQMQMIASMTNYEFYQAVKPYINEEAVEYAGITVIDDDDVIDLPGGPNDELDVEYLMEKMGLLDDVESDSEEEDSSLNPLQRLGARASCRCHRMSCSCCLSHTFSVKVFWHRFRFTLKGTDVCLLYIAAEVIFAYIFDMPLSRIQNMQEKGSREIKSPYIAQMIALLFRSPLGCMTVGYSRGTFTLAFALNNRQLFRRAVNLRRVPRLCYGVPGLKIARVCLELYGINIAQRRICAKIVGSLDIKIKKFRVNFNLGCVRIPILKNAEWLYLGQDGAEMQYQVNDGVANLAENDDTMRYEADDVDMSSDDVAKPEDKLIALFITELWKSLTNMDY
ncbi:uncharacterized protein LOC128221630 [Mya arenaria]|uniref:uncharacterized protein LOC128221630 n=1 Tax=Mya arenaria TaxID=6604 RepID=UPI0022E2A39E|nr:uncharacterized protein LOC128221630 [Mya arenaria]